MYCETRKAVSFGSDPIRDLRGSAMPLFGGVVARRLELGGRYDDRDAETAADSWWATTPPTRRSPQPYAHRLRPTPRCATSPPTSATEAQRPLLLDPINAKPRLALGLVPLWSRHRWIRRAPVSAPRCHPAPTRPAVSTPPPRQLRPPCSIFTSSPPTSTPSRLPTASALGGLANRPTTDPCALSIADNPT